MVGFEPSTLSLLLAIVDNSFVGLGHVVAVFKSRLPITFNGCMCVIEYCNEVFLVIPGVAWNVNRKRQVSICSGLLPSRNAGDTGVANMALRPTLPPLYHHCRSWCAVSKRNHSDGIISARRDGYQPASWPQRGMQLRSSGCRF